MSDVILLSKMYVDNRRARTESTQMHQQQVLEFAKKWDAYDWTKQLA